MNNFSFLIKSNFIIAFILLFHVIIFATIAPYGNNADIAHGYICMVVSFFILLIILLCDIILNLFKVPYLVTARINSFILVCFFTMSYLDRLEKLNEIGGSKLVLNLSFLCLFAAIFAYSQLFKEKNT
jgi:hypothetical protein